jgi:hypothetical protein
LPGEGSTLPLDPLHSAAVARLLLAPAGPGPGGKYQISTGGGGTELAWNRNGREWFYRSGDRMMAVDITTQPSFSAGKAKVLFQGLEGVASTGSTGTPFRDLGRMRGD